MVQTSDSSISDLKIVRRVWYWGTGDSSVYTQNDSITSRYYYTKGPLIQSDGYFVRLFLTDSFGCKYSSQRKIFLSRPTPAYNVTSIKSCDADSLRLIPVNDNLIGLPPLQFAWKVDGLSSTSRVYAKRFSGDTSITVMLKVTDTYGCKDSILKNIKVSTGLPIVDFTAYPTSINCPGPPVRFFDRSIGKTSPIVSREWLFGDGGTSVLQDPTRIYLQPGSYSVFLTITDSMGCIAFKSMPDFLVIGGPTGTYSFTPDTGCSPLTVNFYSQGRGVAKYEWDLADGNIDTNQNLKHTYIRPGVYIPNLTITDSTGCKVGLVPIDSLVVWPTPMPDFTLSKYSACLYSDITLQGLVTHPSPIVSWNWVIDTSHYTGQGPLTYPLNRLGNIDISLKVTDQKGCVGTISKPEILKVFKDSVNNNLALIYRATVENDDGVKVEFRPDTEADFDHYILYSNYIGISAQKQININNLTDTISIISSLNTLQQTYTYAMQSVDVCNNYSGMSMLHTTVELKATGRLNAVELNWSSYRGWDSVKAYTIYKLNDGTKLFDSIGKVSGNVTQYFDSATYCNKVLFYKVKAINNPLSTLVSWSDTAAAVPFFVPTVPGTRTLRATVQDNKNVLVQWFGRKHKYKFTFVVHRLSVDPTNPDIVFELSSKDTFFIDTKVDVQQYSYTYLIFLKDECGGLSLVSNSAKTILLNGSINTDKVTSDPELTWNAYEDWNSGVKNYDLLFKYDSLANYSPIATRTPLEPLSVIHNYINYNQDDYCYQVVAYQKDSEWVESWSNIRCISTSPRLFGPNAITINGDQLNDGFNLKGVFIKTFQLRIWDRWGLLLFETTDINEVWDGTYKGEPMPSDVYVFEAYGYGKHGKYKSLKGNLTILR